MAGGQRANRFDRRAAHHGVERGGVRPRTIVAESWASASRTRRGPTEQGRAVAPARRGPRRGGSAVRRRPSAAAARGHAPDAVPGLRRPAGKPTRARSGCSAMTGRTGRTGRRGGDHPPAGLRAVSPIAVQQCRICAGAGSRPVGRSQPCAVTEPRTTPSAGVLSRCGRDAGRAARRPRHAMGYWPASS